ncbi:MAG: zinc-ribbon domain-containing protein [Clostridiales bacterium]|jgi:hypothetical protein|nr:zinc-ribbon domain-containing protein [Clostridiales bacterium]
MLFLFGIGSGQKDYGLFPKIPCFFCAERRQMRLSKHYSYFHLFFIPIFHFNVTYYFTCPKCSTVYFCNRQKARQIHHYTPVRVEFSDILPANRAFQYCSKCSAAARQDDLFCPICGTELLKSEPKFGS